MVGLIRRVVEAIVISFVMTLMSNVHVLAQHDNNQGSIDGLVRSMGLGKPAMARAPDFNLRDTNGNVATLSGYRGRMVLLNFWATWCRPCRDEMPSMENLSRSFNGQALAVVAVNEKESASVVSAFMRTHGLNFITPLDTDGRVGASYRVYGIPVSYLIDGNGQPIGMTSGPKNWASAEILSSFRKLIGKDSSKGGMVGSILIEPAKPMPTMLRAKAGTAVRGQQDGQSEIVGKLEPGDEIIPLGKVSGAGDYWFMVKTKAGVIGWVRGVEVEELVSVKRK